MSETLLCSFILLLLPSRSALPPAASARQQQVQAGLRRRSRHGVVSSAAVLSLVHWPRPQLRGHGQWASSIQDELHPHLQPLLPVWKH